MANWQEEFLNLLREYYAEQKKRNPRYSMRALAKNLNIAPGPTSALIKGTKVWNISNEWASNVINRMNINARQRERIFALMGKRYGPSAKVIENLDGLCTTHWAYWAVYCCFELSGMAEGSSADIRLKIARRLRLPVQEVDSIVEDLIKNGHLTLNPEGEFQLPLENLTTVPDVTSAAVVNMHQIHFDIAKGAVERLPQDEREFQTVTLSGSSSAMIQVKNEIRSFTQRIAHILNKEKENDQVYRFAIQLFPMDMRDKEI